MRYIQSIYRRQCLVIYPSQTPAQCYNVMPLVLEFTIILTPKAGQSSLSTRHFSAFPASGLPYPLSILP